MQASISERSGQWSRCSVAGTGTRDASSRNRSGSKAIPICLTVFTETCAMTGERVSAAASSTAVKVSSLTMLKAATP